MEQLAYERGGGVGQGEGAKLLDDAKAWSSMLLYIKYSLDLFIGLSQLFIVAKCCSSLYCISVIITIIFTNLFYPCFSSQTFGVTSASFMHNLGKQASWTAQ